MKPEVKNGLIRIVVITFGFFACMAVLAYLNTVITSELAVYKEKYKLEQEKLEEATKSKSETNTDSQTQNNPGSGEAGGGNNKGMSKK